MRKSCYILTEETEQEDLFSSTLLEQNITTVAKIAKSLTIEPQAHQKPTKGAVYHPPNNDIKLEFDKLQTAMKRKNYNINLPGCLQFCL